MTQNSKKSSKTAVGGVITALSIVLMFLTSVIPTLTYALPAAAGFLITLIVIEIDKKWALGVYVAVSLLSVLLIADKEAAVMYIMFFGYYPIVKAIFEKHFHSMLLWVLKFAVFNVGDVAAFFISTYVFLVPFEEMEKYGAIAAWGLLAAGNVIFLLYDFAMTNLIRLYLIKWRKTFRRIFKF